MVMVLVFVTPHLVSEAEFPLPREGDGIGRPWTEHQARVTVNFGCNSRVLTWLLGGLNFHKEHHLFPVICHLNYPAMTPVVEQTCREFGVPYKSHPSFAAGVVSHYRWPRKMGTQNE
jgi:linoleoyl-CoA desaturase